jgi:rare lipoprotein A
VARGRAIERPRATVRRVRSAAALIAALAALVVLEGCSGLGRGGGPERGVASWYGPGFHHRRTANGEIFDQDGLTAAHRTLPFDSLIEVRNLDNGKAVRVRINDRGPFVGGRIIDLSRGAARAIDMLGPGTAQVELRVVRSPNGAVRVRYAVQAGAFADPERARVYCEELRERYPEAVVAQEGAWHRVRVGDFADREEARRLQRELEARGITSYVVAVP